MHDAGLSLDDAQQDAFARAWETAERIDGWLTREQGRVLWTLASAVPPRGRVVEIGSHKGRSTVILGRAAEQAGALVTAIDPFVDGAMFGGQATRDLFERHIQEAELTQTVELLPIPSRQAREGWTDPIDFLYIDGKHDYWTVVDDLRWMDMLTAGARIAIHDAFCSVGVTSALMDRALMRGALRYEYRESTLAVFAPGQATMDDRRELARQLPWFSRNVTIKAARRLHAHGLVRALGHTDPWDPY